MDPRPLSRPGVPRAGLVERQLLSNGSEEFPHVFGSLGGCLKEKEASFTGVRLGLSCGDGPLVRLLSDEI